MSDIGYRESYYAVTSNQMEYVLPRTLHYNTLWFKSTSCFENFSLCVKYVSSPEKQVLLFSCKLIAYLQVNKNIFSFKKFLKITLMMKYSFPTLFLNACSRYTY